MAFGKTFDKSKPAGSEAAKTADNYFRDDKTALNERYKLEHYGLDTSEGDASATDTAANAQGRHRPGGCSVAYVGDYSTFPASPPNGALAWAEDREEFYVGVGGAWVAKQAGRPVLYNFEGTEAGWAGTLTKWPEIVSIPNIIIPRASTLATFRVHCNTEIGSWGTAPIEVAIGLSTSDNIDGDDLVITSRFARGRTTTLLVEKEPLSFSWSKTNWTTPGTRTFYLLGYRNIGLLLDFEYYIEVLVWP